MLLGPESLWTFEWGQASGSNGNLCKTTVDCITCNADTIEEIPIWAADCLCVCHPRHHYTLMTVDAGNRFSVRFDIIWRLRSRCNNSQELLHPT